MKWLITTFVALLVLTALQPWLKTYTECVHMLRSMSAAYVVGFGGQDFFEKQRGLAKSHAVDCLPVCQSGG
jgi:hypothetical protein